MSSNQEIFITEIPYNNEPSSLVDDASKLLSSEAYNNHVSPEQVRASMGPAQHMVVAVDETRSLKGAGILRKTEDGYRAFIPGVAVVPESRGHGVGTQIIRRLEEIAEAERVQTLYITPTSDRSGALYKRLGYESSHPDVLSLEKHLGRISLPIDQI